MPGDSLSRASSQRRVVVTGQGLVTPLGRTSTDILVRWRDGPTAVGPITRFDARSLPVQYACEVRDFEPRREVRNRKLLRLMVGGEDFAFRSATDAMAQAGLTPGGYDPQRLGIALGCHKEGFRFLHLYEALDASRGADGRLDRLRFIQQGVERIPPQIIVEALANAGLYYIAHEYELEGANHNLLSVGTGGLLAIGAAMQSIQEDEADLMLAGAFDSWVNWMCINHNVFTGLLSISRERPEAVHRPFDLRRTGGVPAEGAAMLVLEEREHARRRGVPVLGEILGFAMATGVPSYDHVACADAVGRCIRLALADADCTPADLDLIHLNGEATTSGDWIEARGVRMALGTRADEIPATTLRSATGMTGVAAGAIETLVTLEMLRRGEIPPIRNLEEPDPELPLAFVQQTLRGGRFRRGLVLQRCWPSHCAALVVGRPAENDED